MRRASLAFPVPGLFLATGCAHLVPTSPSPVPSIPFFMNSAGPITAREADLFRVLLYPSAVVLAILWGLLAWNIVRYRKKPTAKEMSPQYCREQIIEVIYTGIPVLLVIALFVITIARQSGGGLSHRGSARPRHSGQSEEQAATLGS